jgi:hypothetical protein
VNCLNCLTYEICERRALYIHNTLLTSCPTTSHPRHREAHSKRRLTVSGSTILQSTISLTSTLLRTCISWRCFNKGIAGVVATDGRETEDGTKGRGSSRHVVCGRRRRVTRLVNYNTWQIARTTIPTTPSHHGLHSLSALTMLSDARRPKNSVLIHRR